MSEVDRHIERASDLIERVRARDLKASAGAAVSRAKRATKYSIIGVTAILLIAFVVGLFMPIGTTGVMITVVAMMFAIVAALLFSRAPDVKSEALPSVALAQLPDQTSLWLNAQRRALPAPAVTLAEQIGRKLATLREQVPLIDEREPLAADVRRLLSSELPELVSGYTRIPTQMRKEGMNGISPDQKLLEGLNVIDGELQRVSEQLASGDLNKLATQGRYLEMKYTES